jgi:3-phenylpropionate/cinnamic acid dioxygenase small subunit
MLWKDNPMTPVTAVPVTTEGDLHAQVSDFYARQMRLLDDGDAEGWAATFTENGTFIASGHQAPTSGRADLVAAVRAGHAELAASGIVHRHWLGMIAADQGDDGTVRARCYALVIATSRGGDSAIHRSTTCDDVLLRHGDGFMVQSRSVTRDDLR